MKIGDRVEWDFKGLPRQGTLVRLGQFLAHVQMGGRKEPIAVALRDCTLRLVAEGEPVEKYRPETAYADDAPERSKPCRAATKENKSQTEKKKPMQSEITKDVKSSLRLCRNCRKPVDAPKAKYCPFCRAERHRKANMATWHKKNEARKAANAAKPLPKCVDCGAEVERKAKRCATCIKAHKRNRQRMVYAKKIGKEPRPYHGQEGSAVAKPTCLICGSLTDGRKRCEACQVKIQGAPPIACKSLRDQIMELADVTGAIARAALTLLGELKRLEKCEVEK
jgi:hypothetical protein